MPFASPGFARLAGEKGRRNRWKNTSPADRKATMARVRAAQHQKYLDRAAALAAERGLSPSPAQLERAARELHLADLADYRVRAWQALNGGPS